MDESARLKRFRGETNDRIVLRLILICKFSICLNIGCVSSNNWFVFWSCLHFLVWIFLISWKVLQARLAGERNIPKHSSLVNSRQQNSKQIDFYSLCIDPIFDRQHCWKSIRKPLEDKSPTLLNKIKIKSILLAFSSFSCGIPRCLTPFTLKERSHQDSFFLLTANWLRFACNGTLPHKGHYVNSRREKLRNAISSNRMRVGGEDLLKTNRSTGRFNLKKVQTN